jgi:hypothetical protein
LLCKDSGGSKTIAVEKDAQEKDVVEAYSEHLVFDRKLPLAANSLNV